MSSRALNLLASFLIAALPAFAQTTPNLHLNLPPFNTPNWNTPLNANFSLLDSFLSGESPLQNLTLGNLNLQVSGTGCAKALALTNIDLSPTNPNKYFRVNATTGALEIVNSACSAVIFSFDDTGQILGNLTFAGNLTTNGTITANVVAAASYQVNGTATFVRLTSDLTLAANTSLQTVLSFTLAATVAQSVPVSCHLLYSQATAAVADQLGISSTVAPVNIMAKAQAYISASTFTAGNVPLLTTTTPTAIVTFTPSAITTVWNADLDAMVDTQSSSAPTIQIMAQQSNASDLLTIKKDSFCRLF